MKKRLITLAIGAGTMAVAGLGIMSPAAHACTATYAGPGATGSTATYPAGSLVPVYAGLGGTQTSGEIGVGNLHGFVQVSGDAAGPSGSVAGSLDGTNGIPLGSVCQP